MQSFILAMVILVSSAVAQAETVATVGGRTITRAELDKAVRSRLIELENERYEALKDGLDGMVAEEMVKLEAKARGVSMENLLKQEIVDKLKVPTDEEVKAFYDQNQEAVQGAPFDAVKSQIASYLQQQSSGQRQQDFVTELKKKYKPTITLPAPVIDVSTAGRPEKGPKNAPVTIIEFSDYECPFCKRAEDAVAQVMKTYGDKVRLVFRDFPLPMHRNAQPAAEAAACANAQGKFWEYHGKLFASSELNAERFKAIAAEIGLDAAKFDACVAKREFKSAVEKDLADGGEAGVDGTPAFFINGRMLSGAQPFEKLKEIIDEELAKKGDKKS